MMSLYDVTESVTVITVPKDRRNGARYGLTACVCVSAGDHHQYSLFLDGNTLIGQIWSKKLKLSV